MATIDASIVLISLPDIFRGIQLNPLTPGNTSYFLWLLMGYMLVTAVLVVSFGRLGDIVGRVRMYNMGFAIFTLFSILLSVTWLHGRDAALFMIVMRLMQGVGGAFIMANTAAILTDAFPPTQRGLALGTNMVAAIAGSFIGLVLGGILGPINWRLVFWVSVPVGIIGTVWGVINLKDKGVRNPARIDWFGNAAFAVGLVAVLVGIVYGIEPYAGHAMGWTNPWVLACLIGGLALLGLFVWIETKVPSPMFRIPLFKNPLLRGGQRGQPHGRPRPGWAHVHPHHLATGDLAAEPRLHLRPNTIVGRNFHAASDRRVLDGGPGVWASVGPLRGAAVRHRRHADCRP